jgi:hypothetical protein
MEKHKIYISAEEEVDNFEKKKNDDLYEYKYDEESTTYTQVSPKQRRKKLLNNNEYLHTFVTIILLMLILPLAFHKLYYSQSIPDKDFVDCHKNLSHQNNHPLTNLLDNTVHHNKQIFSMFEDLDTIRDYELRNKIINKRMMI